MSNRWKAMFSTVGSTGSCSPPSAIALVLVALGVAGCSAEVARFDSDPFSRAAHNDQPAGPWPASFAGAVSGLGAPPVVRPKADLPAGGRPAEVVGRENSAVRIAAPDRAIRTSGRHVRPRAAFAKRKSHAVPKKEAKLRRRSLPVNTQRPPARPVQKSAGRRSVDTRVTDATAIFHWPVHGKILARFGPQPDGQENDGIDIAVAEDTPIKSAGDGVVIYAGGGLKWFGNIALVRHADSYVTAYAHAKEFGVKRGDQVKRGDIIGWSGQTGNVSTPRVHFEIRKGSVPVDPLPLLEGSTSRERTIRKRQSPA
jgi:murein DD-endopeptidase MepM/ murein hydrolase activator NlpD